MLTHEEQAHARQVIDGKVGTEAVLADLSTFAQKKYNKLENAADLEKFLEGLHDTFLRNVNEYYLSLSPQERTTAFDDAISKLHAGIELSLSAIQALDGTKPSTMHLGDCLNKIRPALETIKTYIK
jgi:hypothetical protein